jgi:hypothetical protein
MKKIMAFLAAAGMAVAPLAASAQDASALSLAGSPAMAGVSFLDEGDGGGGGGSTAVAIGLVLIILIGVAAISGNDNAPASP